ncbi:MAG: GTP-binding protein, partial [Promethearchaeota archaeon]
MSKKIEDKLQLISRFLDPEIVNFDSIKKIKDVLEQPINAFNFLGDPEIKILETLFQVDEIGEIASIDQDEPFKELFEDNEMSREVQDTLEENPEIVERIKKAVMISLIIHRMKKKAVDIKKKEQKIVVVGLNNAGKTAILSKFGGKLGIENLASLKPTKGIDRKKVLTETASLAVWDFGGQADYRDKYLRKPEKYFFGVDLVMYVIDVQATERYDEAIEYFDEIIKILIRLEVKPYFLILLHKYDPDIRNDEEILLNVEFLKDLIKSLFENQDFDYDIYLSSIYSTISKEPKFSKFLKNFMEEEAFLKDFEGDKIEQMGQIVEKTLDMVIKLSESMMTQFGELERRIKSLEQGKPPSSSADAGIPTLAPKPAYSSAPPPP